MKTTSRLLALVSLLAALATPRLTAENWPNWRGPTYNGTSPETGLPTTFSKTENVKWTAPMPGPAAATPVVWGDHVFISTTDRETRSLHAMALDRKTGKVLWQHEVAPGFRQDDRSNYASPSPVTDGKTVYFYYGNGELAAFDFAGKKLWARSLPKDYGQFAFLWTYSTSPTLYDGKLIIQVLQRDVVVNGRGRTDGPNDSYLLALDPASGKELWRQIRPSNAVAESREAFTTPIPVERAGRWELLVAGGDCLTGHDPATGKELWRWGTYNPTRIGHWRLVPSAATDGQVALVCAPKGAPVYAIKLGGQGELGEAGIAWKSEPGDATSDVATPTFYRGKFFVVNGERQRVACVDPATGKAEWNGELGVRSKIESSPTAADGKLYFMNFRGDVFVVDTGKEFKLLHKAEMGDPGEDQARASIAVAQGNLFIRTNGKLYCVGQ
jgi:outer membrane protein assembly factor BamB